MSRQGLVVWCLVVLILGSAVFPAADSHNHNLKVLTDEEIQHEFMRASAICLHSKIARKVSQELAWKQCMINTVYDQEQFEKEATEAQTCFRRELGTGSEFDTALEKCWPDLKEQLVSPENPTETKAGTK